MFYFFGAKNLLARHYQPPMHEVIVEPFAGSAAYSCYHLKRHRDMRAVIIDRNDNVAAAWDYLKHCSARDIRKYPTPQIGEYTTDFFLKVCTSSNSCHLNAKMKVTKRMLETFEYQRRRMLDMLWIRNRISFIHDDYRNFPNIEATWFIDAPYQRKSDRRAGFELSKRNREYAELAQFAKSRKGQVIVCEKAGANWLDFEPFRDNKNVLDNRYSEVVWYSNHFEQMALFDDAQFADTDFDPDEERRKDAEHTDAFGNFGTPPRPTYDRNTPYLFSEMQKEDEERERMEAEGETAPKPDKEDEPPKEEPRVFTPPEDFGKVHEVRKSVTGMQDFMDFL